MAGAAGPVTGVEGAARSSAPKNGFVRGRVVLSPGYRITETGCRGESLKRHDQARLWTCNTGFEQVDDRCSQIIAPANARINGNAWVCNPSYIRKGDRCQKLRVPANATVRGNSWSCNAGYRSNGKGQCARIVAPLNATVRGRGWTCNPGFTQTADGKSCRLVN